MCWALGMGEGGSKVGKATQSLSSRRSGPWTNKKDTHNKCEVASADGDSGRRVGDQETKRIFHNGDEVLT